MNDGSEGSWSYGGPKCELMGARDDGITGRLGVCIVEASVSNADVVREREGMCELVCE